MYSTQLIQSSVVCSRERNTMPTQEQVQSTLEAMKKGRSSVSLSKDKRGTGRSYAQQMFQVGKGMKAADLIVSPSEQSAAEARSQLTSSKATKRKADRIYQPSSRKKSKHTSTARPKSNKSKSAGKKKAAKGAKSRKGKKKPQARKVTVSKKKSGFFTRKK